MALATPPRSSFIAAPQTIIALAASLGLTPLACTTPAAAPQTAPAASSAQPAEVAPAPPWWQDAIGYEVFVRSFRDSDGDGVGDLRGLTEKLDHLNDGDPATSGDLGVDLLWLMPINEGPSYHGYAVSDHRAIEADYGSMRDLDALVASARARGIRIVLDLVVNHASDTHPWFVEAASSPASRTRSYFLWRDHDPGWKPPWGPGQTWHPRGGGFYYGLFSPEMPDLDVEHPAVRAELLDVARFWLARGIAGFRLDAARYLVETGPGPEGQADTPATHAFWRALRETAKAARDDALLIGEVWESTPVVVPYFGSARARELDMAFDFDTASGLLNAIRRGDAEPVKIPLAARLARYPAFAHAGTFLANHDQYRVGTVLGRLDASAQKLAAALLLTFPGTPWIYYGEEIGQAHGEEGGDDRLKRRPMQWAGEAGAGFTSSKTPWIAPASTREADSVRGQARDEASLLSTYRRLAHLRRESRALRRGTTRILPATASASEPLVLWREGEGQGLLLVFNLAAEPSDVVIPAEVLPPGTRFRSLLGPGALSRTSGAASWSVRGLEPHGFRVFEAH